MTLATNEASHVFKKPGIYKVRLRVQDAKGASATAQLQIMAGNNIPVVNIKRPDSSSFYWNGFPYEVIVTDKEDGSTSSGGIKGSDIKTYSYYLKEGEVLVGKEVKRKSVLEGERLVMQNDCRSCHAAEKRLIGPAYRQIALRYPAGTKTDSFLVQKIIKGGKGNWGDRAMPPHPNLSFKKVATMVSYIQSLSQKKAARVPLPHQGTWKPDAKKETAGGKYVFKAAYTDKGAKGLLPATGADSFVLRSPTVYPWDFEKVRDVKKDSLVLTNVNDGGYVQLKNINLEGVKSLTWRLSEGGGGRAELRLDAPDGPLISTVTLRQSKNFGEWFQSWKEIHVPVTTATGTHDLYFVFRNESFYYSMMNIEWIRFNNKPVNSFPKQ
jgi:cytochrome c